MQRYQVRFYQRLGGEVISVELNAVGPVEASRIALVVVEELANRKQRAQWWQQGVVVEGAAAVLSPHVG